MQREGVDIINKAEVSENFFLYVYYAAMLSFLVICTCGLEPQQRSQEITCADRL